MVVRAGSAPGHTMADVNFRKLKINPTNEANPQETAALVKLAEVWVRVGVGPTPPPASQPQP
jgi:hypothetical protein